MPRPAMPVGTHGAIVITSLGPKKFEARTRFRDVDGKTKQIRAIGTSKGQADRNVKDRVRQHFDHMAGSSRSDRFEVLIDEWLQRVDENATLSTGTKRLYRLCADRHVRPLLGQLFISEITVPAIDRCLRTVRDGSGRGAAKTTRSVISGIIDVAVRSGIMSRNPTRDAMSLPAERKSATRALTRPEVERLTDAARTSAFASVEHDLADVIEWMLYTGCRIGEALALRYGPNADGKPLLDLEHGTWEVNATVVRITGRGLVVQERTKTDAGWRVLALPPGAVAMLRRRAGESRLTAPGGIVFGSPLAKALRDPSNTDADLREFLDGLDCAECRGTGYQLTPGGDPVLNEKGRKVHCRVGPFGWVTSHTFRKTVATRLDEAGVSARAIADQLGHAKPSMTQDVYMGRQVVNAQAAALLDR